MTISILGCGWLGLPLGRRLAQHGHRVRGSTTTPDKQDALRDAGIEPHLIHLDPKLNADAVGDFFEADVLIWTVPPPRDADDVEAHLRQQADAVLGTVRAGPIRRVLYTSSTSVYPAVNGDVTEEDDDRGGRIQNAPASERGRALRAVEDRLLDDEQIDAVVLRLAGLYGPGRPPGRFLAGRTDVANGEAPVNLVHLDDVIGVIAAVLARDLGDAVFNVCSDTHPARCVFYPAAARALGLEPPTFADDGAPSYKRVRNDAVKETLDYTFVHPDPLAHVLGTK